MIVLAGGAKGLEAFRYGVDVGWAALALGAVMAAVSAYLCIHYFLLLLERIGLLPFVIYRLLLGLGLFIYFA